MRTGFLFLTELRSSYCGRGWKALVFLPCKFWVYVITTSTAYLVTSTQQAEYLEVDTPTASWRACLQIWPFLSSTSGCYYLLPSISLLSFYSKTKLIQMVQSIFFSNFSILTGLTEMWRKNKNCNETTKLLKNWGACVQADSRQCHQQGRTL